MVKAFSENTCFGVKIFSSGGDLSTGGANFGPGPSPSGGTSGPGASPTDKCMSRVREVSGAGALNSRVSSGVGTLSALRVPSGVGALSEERVFSGLGTLSGDRGFSGLGVLSRVRVLVAGGIFARLLCSFSCGDGCEVSAEGRCLDGLSLAPLGPGSFPLAHHTDSAQDSHVPVSQGLSPDQL